VFFHDSSEIINIAADRTSSAGGLVSDIKISVDVDVQSCNMLHYLHAIGIWQLSLLEIKWINTTEVG